MVILSKNQLFTGSYIMIELKGITKVYAAGELHGTSGFDEPEV